MRTNSPGDNLATAGAAAAVVALVPALWALSGAEHFERGVSGYFDLGALARWAGAAAAVTFCAVLLWRTRGFAVLWALALGGYLFSIRHQVMAPLSLSMEDLSLMDWAAATTEALWESFWDRTPLVAGLFLAAWVARFRDARAGVLALLLPPALWLAAAWTLTYAERVLDPYHGERTGMATIALVVAAVITPPVLACWEMQAAWRAGRSAT